VGPQPIHIAELLASGLPATGHDIVTPGADGADRRRRRRSALQHAFGTSISACTRPRSNTHPEWKDRGRDPATLADLDGWLD
jgi:hypothetical protein